MLKVIGAGFGRTGTHSLKLALEDLGFGPCHHMMELAQNADQLALWQDICAGKPVDWQRAMQGYGSQADWPAVYFWKELVDAFPEAKVVLTYRDPRSWFRSFRDTIVRANTAGLVQDTDPQGRARAAIVNDLVFQRTFGGRQEDENACIATYLAHTAEVLRRVPARNLLIFDIADGWQPLCSFLEVPVPDRPFPKTNSKDEFLARKTFL